MAATHEGGKNVGADPQLEIRNFIGTLVDAARSSHDLPNLGRRYARRKQRRNLLALSKMKHEATTNWLLRPPKGPLDTVQRYVALKQFTFFRIHMARRTAEPKHMRKRRLREHGNLMAATMGFKKRLRKNAQHRNVEAEHLSHRVSELEDEYNKHSNNIEGNNESEKSLQTIHKFFVGQLKWLTAVVSHNEKALQLVKLGEAGTALEVMTTENDRDKQRNYSPLPDHVANRNQFSPSPGGGEVEPRLSRVEYGIHDLAAAIRTQEGYDDDDSDRAVSVTDADGGLQRVASPVFVSVTDALEEHERRRSRRSESIASSSKLKQSLAVDQSWSSASSRSGDDDNPMLPPKIVRAASGSDQLPNQSNKRVSLSDFLSEREEEKRQSMMLAHSQDVPHPDQHLAAMNRAQMRSGRLSPAPRGSISGCNSPDPNIESRRSTYINFLELKRGFKQQRYDQVVQALQNVEKDFG